MKIGKNRGFWRGLATLTSACLVIACTSCERGGEKPSGQGAASAPAVTFNPPTVDVSKLTPALQKRIADLRQAASDSPSNPDNAGLLGAIYYVQGFPKAAATCFEHAASIAPDAVHWHYYCALAYEREHETKAAQAAYERALKLDPNASAIQIRLAQLIVAQDPDRAAALCKHVLDADPKSAAAILTMGLVASRKGDNEGAISYAKQALELIPDFREAHALLASTYRELGREDEAKHEATVAASAHTPVRDDPLFERLLRSGLSPDILFSDIEALIRRGALPQAEKALELASEVDPKGDATTRATALLRMAQGRYDEAAEAWRRLLKDYPDQTPPHLGLAQALALAGKYDDAENELTSTLKSDPDNPMVLEAYARFLVSRGKSDKAEEVARAAIDRNKKSAQLRYLLGGLLADRGDDQAAREQLEMCLKLQPGYPNALWTLGMIAQRAGDKDAAVKYWEEAVKSSPDFVQAHISLAQAALEEKKYDVALQHLRNGFKAAPDSAPLANALAWLLATCPVDSLRSGEEAVKLSEAACMVTQNKSHSYLDTLAAAYAEVGRFDDAVRTLSKAIEVAKAAGADVSEYEARLKLYKEKKPYHEPE